MGLEQLGGTPEEQQEAVDRLLAYIRLAPFYDEMRAEVNRIHGECERSGTPYPNTFRPSDSVEPIRWACRTHNAGMDEDIEFCDYIAEREDEFERAIVWWTLLNRSKP